MDIDNSARAVAPVQAKNRGWWVLLLVGIGALGIYLGAPDVAVLRGAWARLLAYPVESIAIVVGGAIGLVITESIRIVAIGRLVGAHIGVRDAWDAAIANHVMTAITPQIGLGEPSVAYTLGKRGVPWDAAVAIPFIKFTTSLALVFVLGALLVATGHGPPVSLWIRTSALVWFVGIAAITFMVIGLFSRPPTARRWIARLARWVARWRSTTTWTTRVDGAADVAIKMVERLARTIGGRSAPAPRATNDVRHERRSGRSAALALLLVVHLAYFVSYIAPLVGIALVLGDAPVVELALRSLVYLCFIFATPIPGGTGASEAAAGLFFADLVAPADAIIAVAVFRVATYYLQLMIGALYLPIRSLALSGR